jgi:hypothetical protein
MLFSRLMTGRYDEGPWIFGPLRAAIVAPWEGDDASGWMSVDLACRVGDSRRDLAGGGRRRPRPIASSFARRERRAASDPRLRRKASGPRDAPSSRDVIAPFQQDV